MTALKIVALVLIAAGALGAAWGGFSYVQARDVADIGPLHLQVSQTKDVVVPLWLSLGAVVAGVLLWLQAR